MNKTWGWALAVVAVVVGWMQWGWQGVVLAITVIVFWLLLQFSRALRVMRQAAGAPVGHVDSAVMLHAKLRQGMRLLDIIPLTRSLGQRVEGGGVQEPATQEVFTWTDTAGNAVRLELLAGRLQRWELQRPVEAPRAPGAAASGSDESGGPLAPDASPPDKLPDKRADA
ncbi:MAG: hypothetical protein ACKOD9_10355 [Rubrivivax sp.]